MSCSRLNHDHVVIVNDYGPKGFAGPVTLSLTQGWTPGGTLTVVASTDHEFFIDVYDEKRVECVFHHAARLFKDEVVFSSFLNDAWGPNERPSKNPFQKGARFTVTVVYEEAGYRVFINGEEELFYKHRTTNPPSSVDVKGGQIYKIVYMNSLELSP